MAEALSPSSTGRVWPRQASKGTEALKGKPGAGSITGPVHKRALHFIVLTAFDLEKNKVLMNSDFLQRNSIIGDSPAMHALACQVDTAASSNLTVLVSGESGTGKELVARAIHENSSRCDKPLVCFNCGA